MHRLRTVGLYSGSCYKTLTGAVAPLWSATVAPFHSVVAPLWPATVAPFNSVHSVVAPTLEDRFSRSHARVVSRRCSGQGGDLKNNPDVKKLLDDIYRDFDENKKDEEVPDLKPKTVVDVDDDDSDKDLKQLLSELYDDPGDKESTTVSGYTEFKDSDATIIYDVDEERELMRRIEEEGATPPSRPVQKQVLHTKYDDIANTHADRGAFSLEELVSVLEREKLRDVAVIEVPKDRNYVDHLVIATARSNQHIRVTATLVRKLYKLKMYEEETVPRIEGLTQNNGWMALDLGNIALHIFDQDKREYYDIETLWLVGPDYDDNSINENGGLDTLEELMAVPQNRLAEFIPLSSEHHQEKDHHDRVTQLGQENKEVLPVFRKC